MNKKILLLFLAFTASWLPRPTSAAARIGGRHPMLASASQPLPLRNASRSPQQERHVHGRHLSRAWAPHKHGGANPSQPAKASKAGLASAFIPRSPSKSIFHPPLV